MTLVVSVNGNESIWMVADRRLSYRGRAPKDDARKIMFLETQDGNAILGYAGLGATARGTEPADWMSTVLRGRNLPLEQSLGVIADAMKKQLPRHMVQMPGPGAPAHTVCVTAFLNGEVRLYTIDLAITPNKKSFMFRYTRHVTSASSGRTPPIAVGGSGARYLAQNKGWMRSLLRLVKAYDRNLISSRTVSDYLARLNLSVHNNIADGTVGHRCIVAWRNRKGSNKEGGGHCFYTGDAVDNSSPALPSIGNGMDIRAIVEFAMARMFAPMKGGDLSTLDKDQINAELSRLPWGPDENLR